MADRLRGDLDPVLDGPADGRLDVRGSADLEHRQRSLVDGDRPRAAKTVPVGVGGSDEPAGDGVAQLVEGAGGRLRGGGELGDGHDGVLPGS